VTVVDLTQLFLDRKFYKKSRPSIVMTNEFSVIRIVDKSQTSLLDFYPELFA